MFRKTLFWGHLLVGVVSGLVLTVSALTGLALSVCPVLVERSERSVPAEFAPQSPHTLSVDEAVDRVTKAFPGFEAGAVTLSKDPTRPLAVSRARKRGEKPAADALSTLLGPSGQVWVSLSNGHVAPAPGNVYRGADKWLEGVHRWFGLSAKPARDIVGNAVGAASLALLFAVGSGLFLWGPVRWWRRSPKAKIPRGARGWHEILGAVASPWLLLLGVTGALMFYDWAGDLLFKGMGTGVSLERYAVPAVSGPLSSRSTQLQHVTAILPDFETVTLLPVDSGRRGKPGEAPRPAEVIASVVQTGSHSPVPTWVRFSPDTGKLNRVDVWAEMPWRQAFRQAAKSIHTGEAFGVAGALLGVFSSAVLLVLCLTGWWMTWKRLKRRNAV